MSSGLVSVIIPANGERFLGHTIKNVLENATGEIEVIAILDGWWPDPPLEDNPRVRILHWGHTRGMRPGINAGVEMAKGKFLLKLDAHCSITPGFDEALKADCADDWVVVPRRQSLDPHATPYGQIKVTGKAPVDAHLLSYPFEQGKPGVGLHGQVWNERARTRLDIKIDEEMSSQGSCWFTRKDYWQRQIGPLNSVTYGNFVQEFQEIGLRVWLGGGKVMVNKNVQYLHWHKGKEGRGYFIDKRHMARGQVFCTRYWMNDRWPERVHDLRWLIERFWPVPTWPAKADGSLDWDRVVADTAEYERQFEGEVTAVKNPSQSAE